MKPRATLFFLLGAFLFLTFPSQSGEPLEADAPGGDPFVTQELPPKLGVSGTWVWQKQNYVLDQFEITGFQFLAPGPGFPPPPLGANTIQSIKNEVNSYTTRVDYWLLPFFNIYGIVGHASGEVDVALGGPINRTFNFPYNGTVYGMGGVAAIGWKDYFLSTDVSYTITDLTDGNSIETWVASPKIGFRKGDLTAWLGATYQATSHQQSGSFVLPPFGLSYLATLSDENNWNGTAGFMWQLNEHWDLKVEGGFGDRHQALVALGYRF